MSNRLHVLTLQGVDEIRRISGKNAAYVQHLDLIMHESFPSQKLPYVLYYCVLQYRNFLRIARNGSTIVAHQTIFDCCDASIRRGIRTKCKLLGGAEDPRWIRVHDCIYVFFSAWWKERCIIGMGKFDMQHNILKSIVPLTVITDDESLSMRHEKNWSPWVFNNKVYVSYSLNPHTVLEVNVQNGHCTSIVQGAFRRDICFDLRGGTPAVAYKNMFIGIGHVLHNRHSFLAKWALFRRYYHYAYIFEARYPFNITRVSSAFTVYDVGIEFITGLEIVDDIAYITIGVNDTYTNIVKVDMANIMSLFENTTDDPHASIPPSHIVKASSKSPQGVT